MESSTASKSGVVDKQELKDLIAAIQKTYAICIVANGPSHPSCVALAILIAQYQQQLMELCGIGMPED